MPQLSDLTPTAAMKMLNRLADKHERLRGFAKLDEVIRFSNKQFWTYFWAIWTSHESVYKDIEVVEHLIRSRSGTDSRISMSVREREVFASLGDKVVIYRGCWKANREGWSWTLNKERAQWFACRSAADRQPLVLRAVVDRENILAYLNGRNEEEIVIDPRHTTNKRRTTRLPPISREECQSSRLYQVAQEGFFGGPEWERMKAITIVRHHIMTGSTDEKLLEEIDPIQWFCEALDLERVMLITAVRDLLAGYRAAEPTALETLGLIDRELPLSIAG